MLYGGWGDWWPIWGSMFNEVEGDTKMQVPLAHFFGQFVNFVIANNVYVGYDFMDGGVMVGVLYNISDVAYV